MRSVRLFPTLALLVAGALSLCIGCGKAGAKAAAKLATRAALDAASQANTKPLEGVRTINLSDPNQSQQTLMPDGVAFVSHRVDYGAKGSYMEAGHLYFNRAADQTGVSASEAARLRSMGREIDAGLKEFHSVRRRYPTDLTELHREVLRKHKIVLPDLPAMARYVYFPNGGTFFVELPIEAAGDADDAKSVVRVGLDQPGVVVAAPNAPAPSGAGSPTGPPMPVSYYDKK